MHPQDCPDWEYSDYTNSRAMLKKEVKCVLLDLRRGNINKLEAAADTRPIHYRLFRNVTPPGYPYYAGHYRGEKFRCLEYNDVAIPGDRRVGLASAQVGGHMAQVAQLVRGSVAGLDKGFLLPNVQVSLGHKISYAVAVACRIFELFLRIHPYVNGNGHAARFLIWAILARYGLLPARFPIDPRPADPPYTDFIIEYRNGNPEPLERFVLQCLDLQSP